MTTKLGEPDYRYYNCNLQAPKIKCGLFEADEISSTCLIPSGICQYNGVFQYATTFTFTSTEIPLLSNPNCSGELTLYCKNDFQKMANVTMIIVVKANGTITNADFYQRVGNIPSVTSSIVGNTIKVVTSPSCICKWIFRGA